MTIVIESVMRISLPKYTLRIWKRESDDYQHETAGFSEAEYVAHNNQDDEPRDLALKILALPGVSAVEVLDWNSAGLVIYGDMR
jgi:hypothetical protein